MTAFYLTMIDEPSDKEKFSLIYNSYKDMMYRKAMSITKNNALAEEVVQESLLKIAKNITKIGDPTCRKSISFIVIIVKNTSLDKIKVEHSERMDYSSNVDDVLDLSIDTIQKIISDSGYEQLINAISGLKEIYSSVLKLKFVHEYSNDEIAELLNIEKRTVEQRVLRGKKLLLKKLEEDNYAIK